FRESLAPVTAIIRDWVAGIFGEVSLSEAFQRGLKREGIDPKAAALWQSLIDLGAAIGELLMESIAAAFDVAELISLLFIGPLARVGTMLMEVGAYWAGAISQGFMEEWGKLEEWFKNTWLGRTLVKLGIIEPPGPTEMDILGMSPEERRKLVRDIREAIGETELKALPTLGERIFPPTVGRPEPQSLPDDWEDMFRFLDVGEVRPWDRRWQEL